MSSEKRIVTIQLMGGVGNQLFQYFAGKYVAKNNNCDLLIDTSRIGVGGRDHGSGIFHFRIPEKQVYSKNRNYLYKSILWRAHQFLLRINTVYGFIFQSLSRTYFSRTLDFDSHLVDIKAPVTLIGYFQTSAYYDELKNSEICKLELKNPSAWYQSTLKLISKNQSLAIHVRRGDYVPLKDSFGLLSRNYYFNAVKEIEKIFTYTQVFIFSDDVKIAREFNLSFGDIPVHFVEPPSESEAVESLMLMSAAQGIIISNSTFAWWSAIVGESQRVIAPRQWFKNMEGPKNILRDNWVALDSDWEI